MHQKLAMTLAVVLMAASPGAALADATNGQTGAPSNTDNAETGDIEMSDKFRQLDANGDGLLSREEAQADPAIGSRYDSFDTSGTMEKHARNTRPGGITEEQFEAGLQATASGGTIGPSASGGETLLVYPDGTMERVKGSGIQPKN
jgi:hypothetical protein